MDSIERQHVAATAEAALASAAALALLPDGFLWLAPLIAAAFLFPALLARIPRARPGDAVFAPDPLDPDFDPLAKTLRSMLEDAQVNGARGRVILTPLPLADGGFAEYRILWRPASAALDIECKGERLRRKSAVGVLADSPMPIRVGPYPVCVTVRRDARSGRALLSVARPPRPLRFLNAGGASPLRSAYIAYVAALLFLFRLWNPAHATAGITLVFLATAPVLAMRVRDFAPRIRHKLELFFPFLQSSLVE